MKRKSAGEPIRVLSLLSMLLLAACATRAPDFGGRWQQANRYAPTTQEIPLRLAYVYAPSPMDGTLRTMLERWTHDAGLGLQYDHGMDYTLHAAVEKIRTTDLGQAAALLTEAYAAQGITVKVAEGRVMVAGPMDNAQSPQH